MGSAPLVVAGGSIAALVAADAALARGRAVELILPRRGVGGGFAPIHAAGRRLGLGVRVLEIDREDAGEARPLAEYEPGFQNHAGFVRRVAELVEGLVGPRLTEVPRPSMSVDGRLVDDVYFTVDLEGLPALMGEADARRTAAEAEEACRAAGDAGVLDGRHDLFATSLEDASRANHGATFHERFIAPMCAKIHPDGAAVVPAALRRKVWMPLFHPRTLARAAAGRPTGYRPHRPFHTVAPGGMGVVLDALLERIRRAPGVTITEAGRLEAAVRDGGATLLRFEDGSERRAVRPVLGPGPQEMFAAVGAPYAPARVPMALAWAEADEADLLADPSLVHAPGAEVPAFRFSQCGDDAPGSRSWCVELRHDTRPDDVEDAVRSSLELTGVLREGAPLRILHQLTGPAFPDPSHREAAAFAAARAALQEARLDAEVVGGASAFGADSFNEQVIQGLRAEETTR
jgi:hypothetical protein